MRKKILKGVFCSALSIVMATGGVFVSAAPKQAEVTTKIQSVQNSKIVNLQQTKTGRLLQKVNLIKNPSYKPLPKKPLYKI